MVNFLEIALEKPLDQETKDVLNESHKASKSLIYVIDDLLHSTDSNFQAPLQMVNVNFNLSEGVMTILDRFRKHASQKALSFNVESVSNPHLRLRGDLQKLQHAIISLISNAIQYTNEGGVGVCVTALPAIEGNYLVTVTVQDTGIGMSEDALNTLFQEFEQVPDEEVDSEGRSMPEGSSGPGLQSVLGMGLALVARFVRQCGGQIRGKSTLGQGSTFLLDVPLQPAGDENAPRRAGLTTHNDNLDSKVPVHRASPNDTSSAFTTVAARSSTDLATGQEAMSQADSDPVRHSTVSSAMVPRSAEVTTPPVSKQVERPTILVADDNSVNLNILKRRLQKMGYDVKTSLNGQECFETFQEQYNLLCFVLMDINASGNQPMYRTIC